jgi:RHS repeat-associated protein
VDGDTAQYVLDLAATLPVVVSDTEAVYLYGLDIIAQQQAERLYYAHDGLGSVRQLLDSTGELEANYAYDPFGVPVVAGDASNPYRFTGEAWDEEVELLYLRARYYQPETGRFITKDPWPGDVWRPATLNPYTYVTSNPANHTDPGGLEGSDPLGLQDGEWRDQEEPVLFEGSDWDHRDLTQWLVEELRTNATTTETREIRKLLWTPHRNFWLAKDRWFALVADRHTWDFKHAIRDKLKLETELIMLRHPGEVYGWYSYQVPGNINFGYVGRAAGWSGLALHGGASYAQVTDPSHKSCLIPRNPRWPCTDDEKCWRKGELRLEWVGTLFDSPEDFDAVEFGVQLYEAHPVNLTVDQFKQFLSTHSHMLRSSVHPDPGQEPANIDELRRNWPYQWGMFNGPLGPRLSG